MITIDRIKPWSSKRWQGSDWGAIPALLVTLMLAIISIIWLRTYADKTQATEVKLLTIHWLASEQNALQWQARINQEYSREMVEEMHTLRRRVDELLVQLDNVGKSDPALLSVVQALQHYQIVVNQEFRSLMQGGFMSVDLKETNMIDTHFHLLCELLDETNGLYRDRTQQANQLATNGTIFTLGLTMLVLTLLVRHFERLRQSALVMATEQQTLRRSEEYLRTLVRNALDIIMISDIHGMIRYISPASQRILGYTPESLVGQSSFTLIHADDLTRVRRILKTLSADSEQLCTFEVRVLHQDGSWRFIEATAHNLLQDPNIGGLVFNVHDFTERKIAEESLQYQAYHDPLTGLPNRALFLDRLHQALARTERQNSTAAVLFLDLDNFKVINDSLGHEMGDQLLLLVAERLCGCVRPGDTVARLGGDEFTILLEDLSNIYPVEQMVEAIQSTLHKPLLLQGQEVIVTVSIGIALSRPSVDYPTELMRAADVAMYQAKAQGKARSVLFEPYMDAHAKARLQLEFELRRALEQDEICVYYQPIVAMSTKTIIGVEALVRWRHPQRGIVTPGAFITVAEETGLIIPIGRRVLELACRQVSEWQQAYPERPPLRLNINLSVRQFQYPTLVADIQQVIAATGLAAEQLEFEITESLLLEDNAQTRQTLNALKQLGVQLALDDFGIGYSSLSYLHRLPIDMVKIDRSFINRLGANTEATAIVNAVMTFAQILQLQVTAEGIETGEQYQLVRNLGCQFGQGYYFMEPLPQQVMRQLLADAPLVDKENAVTELVLAG